MMEPPRQRQALPGAGVAPELQRPDKKSRKPSTSLLMQLEVYEREDDLFLAFLQHRQQTRPKLVEQELQMMLKQMVRSRAHMYNTSDAQVSEFLWVEVNSLGADDDDEDEDEPAETAEATGAAATRDPAAETLAFAQLKETYNRLVDHCLMLARLKAKSMARGDTGAGVRKGRASTALQGEIALDGTVGDTGDIAGYSNVEAASQQWRIGESGLQSRTSAVATVSGGGGDSQPLLASAQPPQGPVMPDTEGALPKRPRPQGRRTARGSTPGVRAVAEEGAEEAEGAGRQGGLLALESEDAAEAETEAEAEAEAAPAASFVVALPGGGGGGSSGGRGEAASASAPEAAE